MQPARRISEWVPGCRLLRRPHAVNQNARRTFEPAVPVQSATLRHRYRHPVRKRKRNSEERRRPLSTRTAFTSSLDTSVEQNARHNGLLERFVQSAGGHAPPNTFPLDQPALADISLAIDQTKLIDGVEFVRAPASRLLEILNNNTNESSTEAWRFFCRHFPHNDCAALTKPALADISRLHRGDVFSKLLQTTQSSWELHLRKGQLASNTFPSPLEVLLLLEEVGVLRPQFWSDALLRLICWLARAAEDDGLSVDARSIARATDECLGIWKQCLSRFVTSSQTPIQTNERQLISRWVSRGYRTNHMESDASCSNEDSTSIFMDWNWSFLPSPNAVRAVAQGRTRPDYGSRFYHFLANYPSRPDYTLSSAALFTFNWIKRCTDKDVLDLKRQQLYSPFSTFIAQLLPYANIEADVHRMRRVFHQAGMHAKDIEKLISQLQVIERIALEEIGSKERPDYRNLASQKTMAKAQKNLEEFFITRLHRCIWSQNVARALALWDEIQLSYKKEGQEHGISHKLYGEVLLAFNELQLRQEAINVWNIMLSEGLTPNVVAWTNMMKGCVKGRDWQSSEELWRRMQQNGVRPDARAWAIRIYSLMLGKQSEAGLSALDEMMKRSKDRDHAPEGKDKDLETSAQPTSEVLNAALSGLVKTKRTQSFARVLSWADRYDVKYDSVTFNILIKSTLNQGDAGDALALLSEMERKKVKPDKAFIPSLFRAFLDDQSLESLSEDKLKQKVIGFLEDLEAKSIDADKHLYTVIVCSLIQRRKNTVVADAVLGHMHHRSIQPTPHIYSTLMSHYFTLQPPDERAIATLWEQIRANGGADTRLYDKMIASYGERGGVGQMMTFLHRMSREGKQPSWSVLRVVVRALSQAGHWDRLNELLDDISGHQDLIRNHSIGGKAMEGKAEFWTMVDSIQATNPNEMGHDVSKPRTM